MPAWPFAECRRGQIHRPLGRDTNDPNLAPQLAAGYLTLHQENTGFTERGMT